MGIFNRKFQEIYNQHQPKIWYMGLSEKGVYFEMISEIYRENMGHVLLNIQKMRYLISRHPCVCIYILLNWWSCLVYAWFSYNSPTYVGETSISACFNVFLSRTGRLICLGNQLPHFLGPHTHPKNLKTQQHPTQAIEPFPQNYHVFFGNGSKPTISSWDDRWGSWGLTISQMKMIIHDNPFTFFFNVPNKKT